MGLKKDSLMVLGARAVSSLASFLAVVLFSRILGASPLGTYYPYIATLGILSLLADAGLGNAVEKRISEGENQGSFLAAGLLMKITPIVVLAVVLVIFQEYVNIYLGADLTYLLIVGLFVQEGARFTMYVLRGELRVSETAVAKVLRPVGWLVIGYLLVLMDYGVHGLVIGYIVGSFGTFALGWWKVSIPIRRPTLAHARSLFDFGKYSAITTFGGFFYSWMDVAVLSLFVATGLGITRSSIGAYENAWRLSLVVTLLARSISMAIFPQISHWDAEDAIHRIEETIPQTLLASLIIAIPGSVGTIILASDLLRYLFGPEFVIASTALTILMGEKIFQSIQVILSRSLRGLNRPDLAAIATVLTIVVNITLNLILIYYFGIAGAALATGIAIAVNTALHLYYLRQLLALSFPLRKLGWSVVASLIMGAAVYTAHAAINVTGLPTLIAIIGFGATLYGLLLLAYPPLRAQIWTVTKPLLTSRVL